MPTYLDSFCATVRRWEGRYAYLYKDTVGKITTGEGIMLPNLTASQALPWLATSGVAATAEQVTVDWNRVAAMPSAMVATRYYSPVGLSLSDVTIDGLTRKAVVAVDWYLAMHVSGYDAFPGTAKAALLDMAYNLGDEGLLTKFPHMIAACIAHKWDVAAAQSERPQLSAERNAYVKGLFLQAVNA